MVTNVAVDMCGILFVCSHCVFINIENRGGGSS